MDTLLHILKKVKIGRKYIIIYAGIFLVIAILLFVLFKSIHRQTTTTTAKKNIYTFSPPATSQTILSVTPQNVSLIATTTQPQVSYVSMDTGSNKVNALQLLLSFDPSLIQIVSIQPTNSFQHAQVLTNQINNTKGTISYAIGIAPTQKPVVGSNNVLLITYTFTSSVATMKKPIHTYIGFLPSTSVGASGYMYNSLKIAYPQHITIDE